MLSVSCSVSVMAVVGYLERAALLPLDKLVLF